MSKEIHTQLPDDLTPAQIRRIKAAGFQPGSQNLAAWLVRHAERSVEIQALCDRTINDPVPASDGGYEDGTIQSAVKILGIGGSRDDEGRIFHDSSISPVKQPVHRD